MPRAVIIASARPDQVMAAARRVAASMHGHAVEIACPERHLARFASSPFEIRALAVDRFTNACLAMLELDGSDALVAVLNNPSGKDSRELMALLFSAPCRGFVSTHDGRLIETGILLRLRRLIFGLWSGR